VAGLVAWPLRSHDLTSLDCCLWGHEKSLVHAVKLNIRIESYNGCFYAYKKWQTLSYEVCCCHVTRGVTICVDNQGVTSISCFISISISGYFIKFVVIYKFAWCLIKLMNVITCTIVLSATIMLKSLYFRTLDLYIKITYIFLFLPYFLKFNLFIMNIIKCELNLVNFGECEV
jgi:hypothetical protein